MAAKSVKPQSVELDLSDVDHRVGKPIGGGQLWEPCSSSDIRRWVMAMDYPNPLHWDQEFARDSKFGGLIAPQSIAVALDYGHGAAPACVGHIPNSHLIFGGEEWWFYGCPVRPGRPAVPGAPIPRLQGDGDEIRRPDDVFARGHRPHQSARRPGGARAFDRDPIPVRRSHQTRHVRRPARRHQTLDATRAGRSRQAAPRVAGIESHGCLAAFRRSQGRRHVAAPGYRPAHHRQLHHRVPGVPVQHLGHLRVGGAAGHRGSVGVPGSRLGARTSPSTRRMRRSIRASATGCMWGRPAVTSMRTGPAKSVWHVHTATARRWARGAPTTSPTGPATTAWCATPRPTSADPRSRATSRTSTPRSSTSRQSPPGVSRSSR